jgi:hypothetical protein
VCLEREKAASLHASSSILLRFRLGFEHFGEEEGGEDVGGVDRREVETGADVELEEAVDEAVVEEFPLEEPQSVRVD